MLIRELYEIEKQGTNPDAVSTHFDMMYHNLESVFTGSDLIPCVDIVETISEMYGVNPGCLYEDLEENYGVLEPEDGYLDESEAKSFEFAIAMTAASDLAGMNAELQAVKETVPEVSPEKQKIKWDKTEIKNCGKRAALVCEMDKARCLIQSIHGDTASQLKDFRTVAQSVGAKWIKVHEYDSYQATTGFTSDNDTGHIDMVHSVRIDYGCKSFLFGYGETEVTLSFRDVFDI